MMDNLYYILKDKKIVKAKDIEEWARFFEINKNRRVGWKMLIDGTTISTVFLGIDHGWSYDELPILFESMVFPWPPGISSYLCKDYNPEKEMIRYRTWSEAEKGHRHLMEKYQIKDPLKILRYAFWPFPKIIAVYTYLYTKHFLRSGVKRCKKKLLTFVKRKDKVFSRLRTRKP